MFEAGEKVAIIGENGIGKTTLYAAWREIKTKTRWSKMGWKATIGYFAQDHEYEFEQGEDLFEWMTLQRQSNDDDQVVRSMLGRCSVIHSNKSSPCSNSYSWSCAK